jgi:hypothetical protein
VRLASIVLASIGIAGAWGVAHAAGDYALESKEWNGLADFAAIATGGGVTIETRAELAWRDIGPSDVLFILYPTAHVDPVHLAAFLRAGGRALIADDYGRADEALARLGILRHARQTGAVRTFGGNPNLPIAVPEDDTHPLTRGVGEIVTNHPSAFTVSPGPDILFGYGRRDAVVVAGAVGDGRFVALSDPSILINDMLGFDGNLAFAVNLLDFLLPTRPGRILVVTQGARLTGEPRDAADEEREALTLNQALTEIVDFLDELNDYLAPDAVLRMIAVVIGLSILAVGAVLLPLRRGRDPDGTFARVAGEVGGYERLVSELDDGRPEHNFAYPAAILRENVETELEERLAALPPGTRAPTLHALELVKRLPPRHAVLALAAHVPRRAFIEAHEAVTAARSGGGPG